MKKHKISFALSSVNPDKWPELLPQIQACCGKYTFEVIAIGPKLPTKVLEPIANFRFIRDFGCPSRCVQIASVLAEGEYFTWLADDCIFDELAFEKAIDFMESKSQKDIMNVRYSEGPSYTGTQHEDPSYWMAWTHTSLQLGQVDKEWKLAIFGLYHLDYFRELGGVDCRFEHINMNSHDFAFRAQRNGSQVYSSPTRVFRADYTPHNVTPVQQAYAANDLPLFQYLYNRGLERPININYHNWMDVPAVWPRKYLI